jgi:hypothetical protein
VDEEHRDNWTVCDDFECRPKLSSFVFEKIGSKINLPASLRTSERSFKDKTLVHEGDHAAFSEGDRCGAKYFTIAGLEQRVQK